MYATSIKESWSLGQMPRDAAVETERAVAFAAVVCRLDGAASLVNIWFPKSCVTEAGEVPVWLANKKADEYDAAHARTHRFQNWATDDDVAVY